MCLVVENQIVVNSSSLFSLIYHNQSQDGPNSFTRKCLFLVSSPLYCLDLKQRSHSAGLNSVRTFFISSLYYIRSLICFKQLRQIHSHHHTNTNLWLQSTSSFWDRRVGRERYIIRLSWFTQICKADLNEEPLAEVTGTNRSVIRDVPIN